MLICVIDIYWTPLRGLDLLVIDKIRCVQPGDNMAHQKYDMYKVVSTLVNHGTCNSIGYDIRG